MKKNFLKFFFKAQDGIRDKLVTGVQTCALPISINGIDAAAQERGGVRGEKPDQWYHISGTGPALGRNITCHDVFSVPGYRFLGPAHPYGVDPHIEGRPLEGERPG